MKKTKDLVFYAVLLYLVVASLFMAHTNNGLAEENERLQYKITELEIENHEIREQRNQFMDSVWSNNHREMMEQEDDE